MRRSRRISYLTQSYETSSRGRRGNRSASVGTVYPGSESWTCFPTNDEVGAGMTGEKVPELSILILMTGCWSGRHRFGPSPPKAIRESSLQRRELLMERQSTPRCRPDCPWFGTSPGATFFCLHYQMAIHGVAKPGFGETFSGFIGPSILLPTSQKP